MARVKRGTISNKTRRNLLKRTKGFGFQRSTKERFAREAVLHAGVHALRDRRKKKSVFRGLWNIKIGASAKALGGSYSTFISDLKKKKVVLNRKSLAHLAQHEPDTFKKVFEFSKE